MVAFTCHLAQFYFQSMISGTEEIEMQIIFLVGNSSKHVVIGSTSENGWVFDIFVELLWTDLSFGYIISKVVVQLNSFLCLC